MQALAEQSIQAELAKEFKSFALNKVDYKGTMIPIYTFCFYGINVGISVEHDNPMVLAGRTKRALKKVNPRLRKSCKFVVLPFEVENGEPDQTGRTAARAYWDRAIVVLYGKDHQSHNYSTLRPLIFNHEFAHLAGETGGAPKSLRPAWKAAAIKDAQHHKSLPQLDCFRTKVKFSTAPMTRQFFYGEEYLNSHVKNCLDKDNGHCEDFAESVSLYLYNREHGFIWKQDKQIFCFETYYPNRSKLINEFLNAEV